VAGLLLLLAALAWDPALRRPTGQAAPPSSGTVQTNSPLSQPGPAAIPSPLPAAIPKTALRAIALGRVPSGAGSTAGVSSAALSPSAAATPPPAAIARRYQLPASHLSDCGSCGMALYHAVSQFPGVLSINRFLGGDREVELLTDPAVLDEPRLLELLSTTAFEPGSGDLTQDQPWMKPGTP